MMMKQDEVVDTNMNLLNYDYLLLEISFSMLLQLLLAFVVVVRFAAEIAVSN